MLFRSTQTMWVAMGESTYAVLGYIKWNMGYHAMLASPMGVRDVLRGHFLSIATQLALATSIFMAIAALFGGFSSWAALWCLPIAVLTGMAFVTPIFAFTAKQEGDDGFNILFRLVMIPLFLFSGTFFPIGQLPALLEGIARVTPLWHGVELARDATLGRLAVADLGHTAYLLAWVVVGTWLAVDGLRRRMAV